jgi:hypothetical protein
LVCLYVWIALQQRSVQRDGVTDAGDGEAPTSSSVMAEFIRGITAIAARSVLARDHGV